MADYNLNVDKSLSHNFIIYKWINILCNEFGVSEGARNLFALIFSFTKDGKHTFNATQQYISDMLYCSTSSIKRYTNELVSCGLLLKDYCVRDDSTRVELQINEEIIQHFFGCSIQDLYRMSKGDIVNLPENKNEEETQPIIMDFKVSSKNGLLKSRCVNSKTKQIPKENKFAQFMQVLRDNNYPKSSEPSSERYIRWLLNNRKVTIEQWIMMIKSLNTDLKLISDKDIREQALISAFDTAFSGGYQKLIVDRYKYIKSNPNSIAKVPDTQHSDSNIEQVANGVFKIVSGNPIDFVKDENGDVVEF